MYRWSFGFVSLQTDGRNDRGSTGDAQEMVLEALQIPIKWLKIQAANRFDRFQFAPSFAVRDDKRRSGMTLRCPGTQRKSRETGKQIR
jgi:hypothetical protein